MKELNCGHNGEGAQGNTIRRLSQGLERFSVEKRRFGVCLWGSRTMEAVFNYLKGLSFGKGIQLVL